MNKKDEKGFVLWFTGLPCSGKTTVANRVADNLKEKGLKIEHLDGDIVREFLTSDLGFSKEDRDENIKRIMFVSKLLSRNGVGVITTFVSPYKKTRAKVREKTTNFIEVFVDCPPSECEKRDIKGMYKLARQGKIENFTGVSDPYEKPDTPEITIYTYKESVEESVNKILSYMAESRYIDNRRGENYSAADEELIEKRLQDLGYIE